MPFFDIIIDLFKARFIKISDKETNEYLKRFKGRTNSYSDGYDLTHYLKYKQTKNTLNDISIEITDYFFRIQDVIGFSVTDLYEKANLQVTRWAHAIFSEPDPRTTCDVFVIMPFSEKLTPIYEAHIKKVCDKIGFDVRTLVMAEVCSSAITCLLLIFFLQSPRTISHLYAYLLRVHPLHNI